MSTETLLITAALSLLTFLLPSRATQMFRDYCRARGKFRALLLMPGFWIGQIVTGGLATGVYLLSRTTMPNMEESLSWLAMAIFFIYVLRTQIRRLRQRVADNDNLIHTSWLKAGASLAVATVRPSLILALCALLVQTNDSALSNIQTGVQSLAAIGLAAVLAPFFHWVIAEHSARRLRALRQQHQASHKAHTRFIASRAVTAGYRRIAA